MKLSIHLNTESVFEKVWRLTAACTLRGKLVLLTHNAWEQFLQEALVMNLLQTVGECLFIDVDLLQQCQLAVKTLLHRNFSIILIRVGAVISLSKCISSDLSLDAPKSGYPHLVATFL